MCQALRDIVEYLLGQLKDAQSPGAPAVATEWNEARASIDTLLAAHEAYIPILALREGNPHAIPAFHQAIAAGSDAKAAAEAARATDPFATRANRPAYASGRAFRPIPSLGASGGTFTHYGGGGHGGGQDGGYGGSYGGGYGSGYSGGYGGGGGFGFGQRDRYGAPRDGYGGHNNTGRGGGDGGRWADGRYGPAGGGPTAHDGAIVQGYPRRGDGLGPPFGQGN